MNSRSVGDTPNYPVKTAFIDTSTSGSNEVVAATSGKVITVLSASVISKLANDVKFLSAATQIGPTLPLGANGGFVLPHNAYGWFSTAAGEALNINLTVATLTGVIVTYIED